MDTRLIYVSVTILEHYETILQGAKTEDILAWLMADSESYKIVLSGTETATASHGGILWEYKQNARNVPNTSLPSYMRYEFSKSAWFRIGGACYTPCQILFKSGIKDKLLPYAIEPDLDDYVTNTHQTATEKSRIQSLLLGMGAAERYSDLSTEALYGILLKLPEVDADGSISRALYRSLTDDRELMDLECDNPGRKEYQEKGFVFCKSGKGFVRCTDARYLTERMVSRDVQKTFNLIDIPSRKSKETIREYLCVPALEIKGKISGTPTLHPLNDAFQNDFNNFKEFAFCYRADTAKQQEISQMKSLKVRLCTELSADYGHGVSALDNCSFIRGADAVYLKIPASLDTISAIRSDIGASEAVAEIVTSLPGIQDGEIFAKLCRLFSQNNENRQAIILREFDSLEILTRSKLALDSAIDLRGMLETVCKGILKGLSREIADVINNIDLNAYHSLANAPVFIRLLDALDIDVQDFNEHSEEIIHIDLRPYFINELDKLSATKKMHYKDALYAALKEKPLSTQKNFVNMLEKYSEHIYAADNTKYFDVEKAFIEQWDFTAGKEIQHGESGSAWMQNKTAFENGKDGAVIATLLANKDFDSLLYFSAFHELEEMYAAKVKDMEEKSGSDTTILCSVSNLVAPVEKICVTAPTGGATKRKHNGTGSRTAGMAPGRDNSSWGAKAEEIVFHSFVRMYKNVKWVSENAKKKGVNPEGIGGLGYDMTYTDDKGQIVYVEIKSTTGDPGSFMITPNEIEVGEREGGKYMIALVANVNNDGARRIYEIRDLFVYGEDESRFSNKRFALSADNYVLRYIKVE